MFLISAGGTIAFMFKKRKDTTTGPNEMEMRPTATADYYTQDQEDNEYDNDYYDEYDYTYN